MRKHCLPNQYSVTTLPSPIKERINRGTAKSIILPPTYGPYSGI